MVKADPIVDVLTAPASIFVLILILLVFSVTEDFSQEVDIQIKNNMERTRTQQIGTAFMSDETNQMLEEYSRSEFMTLYYSLSEDDRITRDNRNGEKVEICKDCNDADISLQEYLEEEVDNFQKHEVDGWEIYTNVDLKDIEDTDIESSSLTLPVASSEDGPSTETVEIGLEKIESGPDRLSNTRVPEWVK